MKKKIYAAVITILLAVIIVPLISSSHREAPLIADDPLADNTDVYAFRSPADANKIILIANYIPFQLPQGGPNYNTFGENIRYEIHVDNNAAIVGDEITYRFLFNKVNEDPTTFFNIRLGKQNQKTTYTLLRSMNGGPFTAIITNGVVPPPNIGPRSISSGAGLNTPDYNTLINNAIATSSTGERVFCGTSDDAFFVDLGGIFDLGDAPRTAPGSGPQIDGLRVKNVSTIAIEVNISTLLKIGAPPAPVNILDPNYVIGVWASASRRKIRTLNAGLGTETTNASPDWVQVSRLGMPLTNEAVIPIGMKDLWNSTTPYQDGANPATFRGFFDNPELSLYMADGAPYFGGAVPAFMPLRVQTNSLQQFDFRNGKNGLQGLRFNPAIQNSALAESPRGFAALLLPGNGQPRSVDLWPIFHTGVPNDMPYQLATGKTGGNPFAAGKPFISNFLPNGGDMLRLNMAVPATPRTSADFSSEGLIHAAVLGLIDPRFNTNTSIQNIPNMDGFPNGRRLEDDVTRIELQAVSGIVLAAIGLGYDDYVAGSPNLATPKLLAVLNYKTGIENNDTTFKTSFPFVQTPWPGTTAKAGLETNYVKPAILGPSGTGLGISSPEIFFTSAPNPVRNNNKITYRVTLDGTDVKIYLYDVAGHRVKTILDAKRNTGIYTINWSTSDLQSGVYYIKVLADMQPQKIAKLVKL